MMTNLDTPVTTDLLQTWWNHWQLRTRSRHLGKTLRKQRKRQGYSIASAATATQIRKEWLSALEWGRWDKLPGEIVGRELLRHYATFLQLDPDEVLEIRTNVDSAPSLVSLVRRLLLLALVVGTILSGSIWLSIEVTNRFNKGNDAELVQSNEPSSDINWEDAASSTEKSIGSVLASATAAGTLDAVNESPKLLLTKLPSIATVSMVPPTETPSPTVIPTQTVTVVPTNTQTVTPTSLPAMVPTVAPTSTPTTNPTATPAIAAAESTVPTPTVEVPFNRPNCPSTEAIITFPGQGQKVSGVVEVMGSASHDNFDYYKLEYSVPPATEKHYFAGKSYAITDGLLGYFDATNKPNGHYDIILTVVDLKGNYPQPCTVTVKVEH